MRVVIAGATGFLGTHLSHRLRADGHIPVRLVRRPPELPDDSRWDPATGHVDHAVIEAADVVVNLAGTNLMGNPHSSKHEHSVLESRIDTTSTLAHAIAKSERKPAFIVGSGISYYGDHGPLEVDETTASRGDHFLTGVTKLWQEAAEPAKRAGSRVCFVRTAPVMDKRSSPLRELRRLFSLGLGARLGDGRQFFPMISLRDWVAAAAFLVESDNLDGPFNLCCPVTPTNAEFTDALAAAVGRPRFLEVPAPLIKLGAGRIAPELLGSVNARPAALEHAGFDFTDHDVTEVLAAGLS